MSRPRSRGPGGTLPAAATTFVGRRRELAEVRRRLAEARLVTLTGVGGVGKTRLALEAARRVQRAFPGGVWFVDLAAVTDEGLVAQAVGTALGVLERSTRPPLDQLVAHLHGRQTLVVLDNCEHLLAGVAPLVDDLLRRSDGVRVLATSRHVLGVAGEHLFAVGPLPVPEAGAVDAAALAGRYAVVQLLVDRATAIEPRFAVTDANAVAVATLCAQLDGLPLAIELAATRLRTLSVDQVVQRLARRFAILTGGPTAGRTGQPRQQSLRSLVDWSYSLCSPGERRLWARLSIFTGSFDLAAAEGVCADGDLPRDSVFDVVDRLVAQSIVVVEPDTPEVRFRLLETIREYGRERLAEHDQEPALRRRHLGYYVTAAEQAARRWCGPTQATDLARLRADHGNLRAAFETALEIGDADAAGRLATALRYHWCADGYLGQGRRWLDEVLRVPGPADELRARALWVAAWICLLQGDDRAAARRLAACQELGERIGDRRSVAFATSLRGTAALFHGELSLAAELFDTAVRMFDADGDPEGELWTLFQLAITLSHQGSHERAASVCHRSLRLAAAHGEQVCRSYGLWVLGFDTWRCGDPAGAARLVGDGLEIQRSVNDPVGAALMIELLAWIAASSGAVALATSRLAAARSLWNSIGTTIDAFGPSLGVHHDACLRTVGSVAAESVGTPAPVRVADVVASVLDGLRASGGPAAKAGRDARPAGRDARPAGRDARQAGRDARQAGRVARPATAEPGQTVLTARELAVAELVAKGLTNRAIAAELVVSPRTVDGHMERILAKLGFTSRAQVAAWLTGQRA